MTQTVSTESPMELSPRERLIQIMKREQALFIRQTLSQKPGYRGGKKAFEYFIRQKIVKAVEAGCGDAEALLRTPKPSNPSTTTSNTISTNTATQTATCVWRRPSRTAGTTPCARSSCGQRAGTRRMISISTMRRNKGI